MNNFSQAPAQIKMFNGMQVIDMKDLKLSTPDTLLNLKDIKKLTDMML